jgi:hypothetical protein
MTTPTPPSEGIDFVGLVNDVKMVFNLAQEGVTLMREIQPVVTEAVSLLHEIQPILQDIQPILHAVQPVINDVQIQLRGPSLRGWEQLGTDSAGAFLSLVDALAALKSTVGAPSTTGGGSGLFGQVGQLFSTIEPLLKLIPGGGGLFGEQRPQEGK